MYLVIRDTYTLLADMKYVGNLYTSESSYEVKLGELALSKLALRIITDLH